MQREGFSVPSEHFTDPPELLIGQEELAFPHLVLADVEAPVRAFGPHAPLLGLIEHGAQDFAATVGRAWATGVGDPVEPFLDMTFLDLIKEQAFECPVEIFPSVVAMGVERGRLPPGRYTLPIDSEEVPVGRNPFINETRILPCTEVAIAIYAAWEGIVVNCASPSLEPRPQTGSNISGKLELHWTVGLLLHNSWSAPRLRASHQVAKS